MWVAFLFGPGKEEGLLMFDHSIQLVYTCISVRKKGLFVDIIINFDIHDFELFQLSH